MKKIVLIAILLSSVICNAQKDSLDYIRISSKLDKSKSISDLVIQSAKLLLGNPYIGGTLDEGESEKLVINFDKFDCVTFQETCSALAMDAKSPKTSFTNFKSKLESLRYHDGKNSGYASRLHYSTDWIIDNVKRKNVTDVTQNLGGIQMNSTINFMSTHSDLYKHLKGNAQNISKIKETENFLNKNRVFYIPKSKIAGIESKIQSGSLIMITTSKAGLDFAHVGIAYRENGVLKLIHASSTAKKVVISPSSISSYLSGISSFSGISVMQLN